MIDPVKFDNIYALKTSDVVHDPKKKSNIHPHAHIYTFPDLLLIEIMNFYGKDNACSMAKLSKVHRRWRYVQQRSYQGSPCMWERLFLQTLATDQIKRQFKTSVERCYHSFKATEKRLRIQAGLEAIEDTVIDDVAKGLLWKRFYMRRFEPVSQPSMFTKVMDKGFYNSSLLPDGRLVGIYGQGIGIWDPEQPAKDPIVFGRRKTAFISDHKTKDQTRKAQKIYYIEPFCFKGLKHSKWDVVNQKFVWYNVQLCVLDDGRVASVSHDGIHNSRSNYKNGTVRIWNPALPEEEPKIFKPLQCDVYFLSGLPNRKIIAGCSDKTLRILNQDDPDEEPLVIPHHKQHGQVKHVTVLPKNKFAIESYNVHVWNLSNNVHVWDLNDPGKKPIAIDTKKWFRGHEGRAVLPDGRIAFGSGSTLHIVNPDSPQTAPVLLSGHRNPIYEVLALSDGYILSMSRHYHTGQSIFRLWNPSKSTNSIIAFEGVLPNSYRYIDSYFFQLIPLLDGRFILKNANFTMLFGESLRKGAMPISRLRSFIRYLKLPRYSELDPNWSPTTKNETDKAYETDLSPTVY